ncbi:Hsp20/alpha crystallin family protein [Ectothiorhodospiraceae bacterium 2226]|nr:Hsp20/alpha crystallin family protein [Ectothiorhodospiraceae bacterium 2226]
MERLNTLRRELGHAWQSVADGWNHLRERAGTALTRFQPRAQRGEVQTRAEQAVADAARWGLLTAEVRDEDDRVRVRMEIPGMDKDDFDISVQGDRLVVRGEKRARREQQSGRYYLMECAYGSFERVVPLPAAVLEEGARARYQRGVLEVTLAKNPLARRRNITITTGNGK